ncbi:hypothetical protein ACI0FN_03230 [Alcaligenes nematophilus]
MREQVLCTGDLYCLIIEVINKLARIKLRI